jgi:hypothetical protein
VQSFVPFLKETWRGRVEESKASSPDVETAGPEAVEATRAVGVDAKVEIVLLFLLCVWRESRGDSKAARREGLTRNTKKLRQCALSMGRAFKGMLIFPETVQVIAVLYDR